MRLELLDVSVAYGATVVLRDVTVVVPSGSVVAILGPNGAGKTTLLGAASGLLGVKAGSVRLDREDCAGLPFDERARRGLCHITEGRSIFPSLSVRDNLRLFSPAADEDHAIDRAVLAFPRLGQRINQIAGTMSGGEQQMLAMSRAYVCQAPLVLLDEPSMGLAPMVIDEIFDYLARLASEGTSILIAEQYVGRALSLADRVFILSRGRVAFAGEPGEIEGADIFSAYVGAEP